MKSLTLLNGTDWCEESEHLRFSKMPSMVSQFNRRYNRTELNIAKYLFKDSKDYINVLDFEGEDSRTLVIGTEKGKVVLFSMKMNRIMSCYQTDQKWLSTIILSREDIYFAGKERRIAALSMRSGRMCFSMGEDDDMDGYGSKGIKIVRCVGSTFVVNCGYGRLKVINMVSRKVLARLDVGPTLSPPRTNPVIMNYCLVSKSRTIAIIFESEDCLHIFDFKLHRLVFKLQLYDGGSKCDSRLLINSLLITDGDYLVCILQFTDNKPKPKITTVIYIIDVRDSKHQFLFYKMFSKAGIT